MRSHLKSSLLKSIIGTTILWVVFSAYSDAAARIEPPGGPGGEWQLDEDMIAADSAESFARGAKAMDLTYGMDSLAADENSEEWAQTGGFCAVDAVDLSRLSFWGHLILLPGGTRVKTAESRDSGVKTIEVLNGRYAGTLWWLYPESASKLGFLAPGKRKN